MVHLQNDFDKFITWRKLESFRLSKKSSNRIFFNECTYMKFEKKGNKLQQTGQCLPGAEAEGVIN